jgi:hypothetical protein
VVAGAAEVAVVGRALLLAEGGALRAVHVEDDAVRRPVRVHPVDRNRRLIPTAGSSDGRSAPHATAVWAGSICQELARPV